MEVNVINLDHMCRGGVYPLPLWVAILREGVNPSPTLKPLKLMALNDNLDEGFSGSG